MPFRALGIVDHGPPTEDRIAYSSSETDPPRDAFPQGHYAANYLA